jgi:integrase
MTEYGLTDWFIELAESGTWSAKTLNNALTALVACLNQAIRDGELGANPAAHVQPLPLAHIERDFLRLHEISRYLDACTRIYRPLAETLIRTGMRISEALALVISDIDLARGAIIIQRTAKGHGRVGAPRGRRRSRPVASGPLLRETLDAQIARRTEHTTGDVRHPLVFTMPVKRSTRDNAPWAGAEQAAIKRTTVSHGWHKEALATAGLRDMPRHSLRHTAAAAWLATGHPLIYVQRQLGHAQITTTERLYGHPDEGFMRDVAAATESAIERGSPSLARYSA